MSGSEVAKANHSWREIAEQASKEENPDKLAELTQELIRELDKEVDRKPEIRNQSRSPDELAPKAA